MTVDTRSQTESITSWLLGKLDDRQKPMSFQELEADLLPWERFSHRTLKETAWKLVEEGKIRFTTNWDLEIVEKRDF